MAPPTQLPQKLVVAPHIKDWHPAMAPRPPPPQPWHPTVSPSNGITPIAPCNGATSNPPKWFVALPLLEVRTPEKTAKYAALRWYTALHALNFKTLKFWDSKLYGLWLNWTELEGMNQRPNQKRTEIWNQK